jgi:hypothetical protein
MSDIVAPTPEQLAEAKDRAAKIGMTVHGRQKFSLGDGPRMDFDSLIGAIELAEAGARGEPTFMMMPCGSGGMMLMHDEENTSFNIFQDESGDLTIDGVKYKKTWGSKTDLETGETIQFDVLDDGSHKETRRFPKEEDDVPSDAVLTLARRVKTLIEKGDRAAEKAEQFYKSAGIHIKEIKQKEPAFWEGIVRHECGLGRSRAYELMAIADGKTTLEKVRDRSNRSSKISHAKKSAVQRTEEERADRAEARCAAQWRAFTAEEQRNAEISIDERKAQNAALDTSSTDQHDTTESAQALAEFVAACRTWLPKIATVDEWTEAVLAVNEAKGDWARRLGKKARAA